MIIKKKHGKNISSGLIRRMSKSCIIPSAKNLSVHDCVKLRALAFREYKTYAKDADLHRDGFYEVLAEAKAEEGDITKCNALK